MYIITLRTISKSYNIFFFFHPCIVRHVNKKHVDAYKIESNLKYEAKLYRKLSLRNANFEEKNLYLGFS